MKIKATYERKPVPTCAWDWTAIDEDTYDGPDSPVGCGATEAEAVADLLEQLEEERDGLADMEGEEWPEDPARAVSCYRHGDPFDGR